MLFIYLNFGLLIYRNGFNPFGYITHSMIHEIKCLLFHPFFSFLLDAINCELSDPLVCSMARIFAIYIYLIFFSPYVVP